MSIMCIKFLLDNEISLVQFTALCGKIDKAFILITIYISGKYNTFFVLKLMVSNCLNCANIL